MSWYLNVIKNHYADFKGRASRQEYWMYTLINSIIAVVLSILSSASDSVFLSALFIIYYLIILVPSLAVAVRRLHDTGKNGWTILLSLIPLVGGIILLVFMCTDSQSSDNKYGPNPKNTDKDLLHKQL
jgi:uncharacterized membrane protein YhaH (DUF805 family)